MLWLQRVQPDSCPVKTVANNKSCIVIRLGWPPPPQSLPWDGGSEPGRGPEPPGGVEAEAQQRGLAGSLQAAEHTGNDPSVSVSGLSSPRGTGLFMFCQLATNALDHLR